MNAAASNVVERKGGRVKVEIGVFIGELLGAETKMQGKPFQSTSNVWSTLFYRDMSTAFPKRDPERKLRFMKRRDMLNHLE
jgi:hypothetical protein